jgi:hypothetical protein
MGLLPRAIALQGVGFAARVMALQGLVPSEARAEGVRPKKMIAYPGAMMNR